MHDQCDLLIDKANAPWFSPTEKDKFLNLAINEYVKNKYRAFEVDEKVREDLLTLVSPVFTVAGNIINLDAVPNFLFILMINADINSPCGDLSKVPVKPIQYDKLSESQRDPFNVAADKYPQYTQNMQGGLRTVEVISPTIPTLLRMVYLTKPAVVDIVAPVNCNLPEHTHEEIVNLAVRKMLGTIEGFENYQVQQNEINKQE
jgi:hypothetical protein